MMLDGLSKAATSEPAIRGSGRSGQTDDGEAGFSSALTRLSGRGADEGKPQAGAEADGDAHGEGSREKDVTAGEANSPAPVVSRISKFALATRHGLAETASSRISISQAGLNAKVDPAGVVDPKRGLIAVVGGKDATEEAGEPSEDGAASSDANAPEGVETQGTTELLSILAGPAQAWSASGRNTAAGEGRASEREGAARGGATGEVLRRGAAAPGDTLEMPTTELDDAVEPARGFRFSDGKGGDVAAELTRAANPRENVGEKRGNAAAIENVSIVESRRFLGLAPTSNSTSLLAGITGDPGWSSAMRSGEVGSDTLAGRATGSAVQMLKLQMTPHDLGTVTATLRLIGEELHVHLTVETRAAYRQLSEDSKGMLDALKSHGFSVDQVTINISSTSETDQQKGQQNAATGQQMAGNGEKNGNAQNREQQQPGFDIAMDGRADGNELGADKIASSDPVGARSGQLYL
ncbi:flagellar hook-length control protein FliK [Pseudorhizobium sp. NPDC055634]